MNTSYYIQNGSIHKYLRMDNKFTMTYAANAGQQ